MKIQTTAEGRIRICLPLDSSRAFGVTPKTLRHYSVEADDGYVFLRGEALDAHSRFTDLIRGILLNGIAHGEYQSDLDTEASYLWVDPIKKRSDS
jgi:hypothetical protein